jgi:hypothetical protein
MLTLTHVRMQLDRLSVAPMKGLVLIEDSLNGVFAVREIFESANGVALCGSVNQRGIACPPSIHGDSEDQLRAGSVVDLETWLGARISGEQEQQTTVERLGAEALWKSHRESLSRETGDEQRSERKSQTETFVHGAQYTSVIARLGIHSDAACPRGYHRTTSSNPSVRGALMLDRWRLAIVLALFGFLASGALIVNGSMSNYSELETRWGWVINVACPAHFFMTQFFSGVNDGTPTMLLLMIGQTAANAAIWFAAGALVTRIFGS